MIKIPIEQIEIPLKIKLRRNWSSFGSDTASCTGWAKAWTDDEFFYCEYGVIDTKTNNTIQRYMLLWDFFQQILPDKLDRLVIEAPFLKYFRKGNLKVPQVTVFKVLARISMIPLMVGLTKGYKKSCVVEITPTKSRAALNLNSRDSKEKIQIQFMLKTGIEITQNDAMDAVILAVNGVKK
ncbi:MAG: hypothetical protein GX638_14840 [Crenarchaeota archaeon]|nr:hypothetical protein [Thermoproteota archaeon]